MKILIVSATGFEIAPLQNLLEEQYEEQHPFHYKKDNTEVILLITGVGLTATAFALGRILSDESTFDLVINLGVAGAFNRDLKIGEIVEIVSEQFGDLGVEEADGSFTDIFEMGLTDGENAPFEANSLKNSLEEFNFFRKVRGLTINKVHGNEASIKAIRSKYSVDVESMEGAAFFYACKLSDAKCLQLRAISNYVESRNRDHWNLPLAIDNLNKAAWGLLKALK